MRLITLNTWGSCGPYQKRWDFLVRELKRHQPDILFLQEVWKPDLISLIQSKLDLQHSVSSFEPGLAILSKTPISLLENYSYQVRSLLESHDRRLLLAELKMKSKRIVLGNTHLAWKPLDESTRLRQIQELVAKAGNYSNIILGGDFNDSPESAPIQTLFMAGFKDLFETVHPDSKALTWDNQNPYIQTHETKLPDRRIDFLFANTELFEAIRLKNCEIIFDQPNSENVYPSDHYGVLAEIELE